MAESGVVVFQRDGTVAKFDETRGVLWVGFSKCPHNDEIDCMWTIVSTFVNNYHRNCIIHLAHIDTPELEPPQLQTMIHIVSKIVTESDKMAEKCKKIFVQPKYVDEKVIFAQKMFLSLLSQKVSIEINGDSADIDRKIAKSIKSHLKVGVGCK